MYLNRFRQRADGIMEQLWRSDEDVKIQEFRPVPEPSIEAVHAIVEPRTVK